MPCCVSGAMFRGLDFRPAGGTPSDLPPQWDTIHTPPLWPSFLASTNSAFLSSLLPPAGYTWDSLRLHAERFSAQN